MMKESRRWHTRAQGKPLKPHWALLALLALAGVVGGWEACGASFKTQGYSTQWVLSNGLLGSLARCKGSSASAAQEVRAPAVWGAAAPGGGSSTAHCPGDAALKRFGSLASISAGLRPMTSSATWPLALNVLALRMSTAAAAGSSGCNLREESS